MAEGFARLKRQQARAGSACYSFTGWPVRMDS